MPSEGARRSGAVGEQVLQSASLRDARFVRVLIAFAGFRLGEGAMWLATLVYAFERGGVGRTGTIAVVGLVAAMVVAPFAAFAGDRFRTDHALSAGHLVQGTVALITAVSITAGAELAAYAGAIVASASFTLTRPVVGALLPEISRRPADLVRANVTVGVVESGCVVAGPLLASTLLAWHEAEAVFFVFTGVGLSAAALTWDLGLDDSRAEETGMDRHVLADQVFGGLKAIWAERTLGLLVVTMSIGALSIGATDVLSVTFAEERLDAGGGTGAGYLMAGVGAGAVLGSLSIHRFLAGGRLTAPFLLAAVAISAPFAVLAGVDRLGAALVMFAVVGLGDSILRVTGSLAMQRMAPRNLLVRMFGISEALRMAGMALGALAVPLVVHQTDLGNALVVIGVGILLVAVGLVLLLGRRLSEVRPPAPHIVDRLLADELFTDFDVLRVEALAGAAEQRTFDPDVRLVAQGDIGTDYFLIEAGRVDVLIDDEFVRQMGPGDSFGEIALLRDVPRTATVCASERVDVLAIERESFLEAVTGRPHTHETAEQVVDKWLADGAPRAVERGGRDLGPG